MSGIEGVLDGKSFWCKKCKDQLSSGRMQEQQGEDFVAGPLKWLQENPGRQLLTGSFHPVDDAEWDTQAYQTTGGTELECTKMFIYVVLENTFALRNAIVSHDASAVQLASSVKADKNPEKRRTEDHPLLIAGLLGRAEVTDAILRAGVKVESVFGTQGFGAIHYAAGNADMLR